MIFQVLLSQRARVLRLRRWIKYLFTVAYTFFISFNKGMKKILFTVIILVSLYVIYAGFYYLYSIPHYIPRRDLSAPKTMNGVPLVIYNSWQSHIVPKYMKQNILTTVQNNPEFDYYLFSDSDCRAFIKANYDYDVVSAFDSLRPGAYKSDLWRYCILYKLGGVYFDIKIVPLVPLTHLLKDNTTVFVKDLAINHTNPNKSMTNMRECVWNGLMISPPNNEIFRHCIEEIVESCKGRLYRANSLDITGPCLLGRMIKKHNGSDFFKYVMLNLVRENNTKTMIYYHNIPFFRGEYPQYRDEQKTYQNNLHYHDLYQSKRVYA